MPDSQTYPLLTLLSRLAVGLLFVAALVPRARYAAEDNVGDVRTRIAIESGAWPTDNMTELGAELTSTLLQSAALAAHLLAALALTWILRETHSLAAGLFSLALWGSLPIAILHGSLWGPENAGLACGLLCGAGALGWIRRRARLGLTLSLLVGLLGAWIGPTGPCFALAVVLPLTNCKRGRIAACTGLVLAAGASLLQTPAPPITTLPAIGKEPLEALGLAALLVSSAGVLLRSSRWLSPTARQRLDDLAVGRGPSADLTVTLLAAGLASLLLEEEASLVLLTPAVAAAGAAFFVQLSRPLLSLRAGLAPVVVALGLVVLPGLAGFEHMRKQYHSDEVES